jgi:hypothetical protein
VVKILPLVNVTGGDRVHFDERMIEYMYLFGCLKKKNDAQKDKHQFDKRINNPQGHTIDKSWPCMLRRDREYG